MELHIVVPGEPVGKQVAVRAFNGHGQVYIAPKIRKYIEKVSSYARASVSEQGWTVPEGDAPINVDVIAYMPVRMSYSRKKVADLLGEYHTKIPDRDNILKSVCDGLMGPKTRGARTHEQIVIIDDGQIADGRTTKRWCPIGEERLEIVVTLL